MGTEREELPLSTIVESYANSKYSCNYNLKVYTDESTGKKKYKSLFMQA